jgi:hypothetical protein
MALWGNNDAVGSGGTVTLDYSNKVVSGWAGTATGTGTTFGQIGAAKTGDIISFGQHGSGTYFGEAVIVSIASSLQCTIASTEALNGSAIAGVNFTISEKPIFTLGDATYNIKRDGSTSLGPIETTGTADAASGIATDIVFVTGTSSFLSVGNVLVNGSDNIPVSAIAATTISLGSTIGTAIAAGDTLTFKEWEGGYDAFVYGVASGGNSAAEGTQYETGVGWVGVTTYNDNSGALRVKKEILVAMSGISTGNSPAYPDMN